MDPLIERFERILRSFFSTDTGAGRWEEAADDQDFQNARDELDDFLKSDNISGGSYKSTRKKDDPFSYRFRMPPDSLKQDYQSLEVPFGASFDEVRAAYRSLMRRHHPDIHTADREQQERATRKAQELNISYQRIKAWELAKRGS